MKKLIRDWLGITYDDESYRKQIASSNAKYEEILRQSRIEFLNQQQAMLKEMFAEQTRENIRDSFAQSALQSLASQHDADAASVLAYRYADAMLAKRSAK